MINFSEVEGPTIKVQQLHETRSKFWNPESGVQDYCGAVK